MKTTIVRSDEYRQTRTAQSEGVFPTPSSERRRKTVKSQKGSRKKDWIFNGWSASTPFLAELMRTTEAIPQLAQDGRFLQSGVLAYQRREDGEPLVLLVSKSRSKRWGIPKGKIEAQRSFAENAAKEAFEEAGVIGRVSPGSVGVFRARKRAMNSDVEQTIEVWVYLLEVTTVLSNWPEKEKRQTTWMPCKMAAQHLREPVLVQLCNRLAQS
jgi:8-oxo-dGTP pyrophosphatase MutT (NUDIX family)